MLQFLALGAQNPQMRLQSQLAAAAVAAGHLPSQLSPQLLTQLQQQLQQQQQIQQYLFLQNAAAAGRPNYFMHNQVRRDPRRAGRCAWLPRADGSHQSRVFFSCRREAQPSPAGACPAFPALPRSAWDGPRRRRTPTALTTA